MNVPPPRVREVLSLIRDLRPAEARALLGQVVATLDAAEVLALRTFLPPAAVHCLPACVGAVTIMNEAPMPWEFVEPPPSSPIAPQLIVDTLPPSYRTVVAIAVSVFALTVGLAAAKLWPSAEPAARVTRQPPRLVPPPPAGEYAPMATPKSAPAKKAARPARKTATTSTPATTAAPAKKAEGAEWASPFDRRH